MSGDDSIWFPSVDEFFEYWFMRTFTTAKKTVVGQNITYKLYVPKAANFWFRNLTCLISNIASLDGVDVVSSLNCPGTSFAIKDGQLMVNLDFNADLLEKVERYVAKFEGSLDIFDYEDAQYFVQMLKAGIREPYQLRLDMLAAAPTLTSIIINDNDDITNSRDINIGYTSEGAITHYMVSESATFVGAEWIEIAEPILFELSSEEGVKTVYVKFKNDYGESEAVSDTIEYINTAFGLTSVSINGGESVSLEQEVSITVTATGENTPTQYKVSETADLSDASWQTYVNPIPFTLSTGVGTKTVYVQISDGTDASAIVSDTIDFVAPIELTSISINEDAVDTTNQSVSVAFTPVGTPTHYMLSESATFVGASWVAYESPVNFTLSSGYATKTIYAKVKDANSESEVVSDTISYVEASEIGRKIIVNFIEGTSTTSVLPNGETINTVYPATYEGWDNIVLKDSSGVNVGYYVKKPSQNGDLTGDISSFFSWANPVLSGDTGTYPDSAILVRATSNGLYPEVKKGLAFIIPSGIYSVRILMSSSDADTQHYIDIGILRYEINGTVVTPIGNVLNNATLFTEIDDVVVGVDGLLTVCVGNTYSAGIYSGYNLIEIIRTA